MTRSGYTFEKNPYGYKLTQWGELSQGEVRDLRDAVLRQLAHQQESFAVLVDVRGVVPPSEQQMPIYTQLFQTMLDKGCRRLALIAKSPVVRVMAARLCSLPPHENIARIYDTWNNPDCASEALAWLDPTPVPAPIK